MFKKIKLNIRKKLVRIACKYIQKHKCLNVDMEDTVYLKYSHTPFQITNISIYKNINGATEAEIKLIDKHFSLTYNKKH